MKEKFRYGKQKFETLKEDFGQDVKEKVGEYI
jgi:hypothetical protein